MDAAESLCTVSADSILAREMLVKLQKKGSKNGAISFPELGKNFPAGKLVPSLGASAFKI